MTECNLCGSDQWLGMPGANRSAARCATCGSLERTRVIKLTLDRLGLPEPGSRVLHLAPERALTTVLEPICGSGYDPVDIAPKAYPHTRVRQFDLIADSPGLPSDYYDLILHCHVFEHVPCNLAYLFYHLSRALKQDGIHIFAVPIYGGYYEEYYGPLSPELAHQRFGQSDHVRAFGRKDFDRHLGLIMRLDSEYSLYRHHSKEELDRYNIPESQRSGLNSSTIFVTCKQDYLLQPAVYR